MLQVLESLPYNGGVLRVGNRRRNDNKGKCDQEAASHKTLSPKLFRRITGQPDLGGLHILLDHFRQIAPAAGVDQTTERIGEHTEYTMHFYGLGGFLALIGKSFLTDLPRLPPIETPIALTRVISRMGKDNMNRPTASGPFCTVRISGSSPMPFQRCVRSLHGNFISL